MEKQLVTRGEVRAMGLNVSSTQFGRWEEAKLLTPLKAGGFRSARVRYRIEEVWTLIGARTKPRTTDNDVS